MSATEELRRLLDERGVRYDVRDGEVIKNTYWEDADGRRWGYASDESGVFNDRQLFLVHGRMDFTPEQAIAATLGAETCKLPETCIDHGSIEYSGVTEWRRCSACGTEVLAYPVHFCPNCGRKVAGE